jgi:putative spermidine/putrescine transport system substrate-binding protein/mannopine transport system substrate-binding protein
MKALKVVLAVLMIGGLAAVAAGQSDPLKGEGSVVLFSYGGSWTEAFHKSTTEPFTHDTGIAVVDAVGDFSETQIKAMFAAKSMKWDFAEVQAALYPTMSEAGMFEKIDYSIWNPTDLQAIRPELRRPDAVGGACTAQGLAYDTRVFPKGKPAPTTWADFWDVQKFPGTRGLYAPHAKHNLVMALVADGVSRDKIWPLTDDKVERALKKLDQIRPHITKWWTSGGEAPQLLANRELAMTSMFSGRAIAAAKDGVPLHISYDGAPQNCNWWIVPKGAPNLKNAQKFVAFLNRAQVSARFAEATGYPLANEKMYQFVKPDIVHFFSTSPENRDKVVMEDSVWLATKDPASGLTNLERINQRWLQWKAAARIK